MTVFNFSVSKINGTTIPGQRTGTFDPRERDDLRGDDGTLHQTSAAVIRTAPKAEFSTVAVRTLVGLLTGVEVPFVALDGTNGMEMFGLRTDTTGGVGRDSGTVHARRKMASGLLLLDRLSWSPGDVLEASCSAYGTAALGTTQPWVEDVVAAPTVPVNTERLVLTSLAIGALNLTRISSFELTVAHQVENNDEAISYDKGLPHPILCKQPGLGQATEMVAVIETTDLTSSVTTSAGLAATFSVLNAYGVGAGATGITVALNSGYARARPISNSRRRIEVRGLWNGTTRPLTLAQI